jgi:hypothetical protein
MWSHGSPRTAHRMEGRSNKMNSKHEIRNSKQIQILKRAENSKRIRFEFRISILRGLVVSDFGIRISDFC